MVSSKSFNQESGEKSFRYSKNSPIAAKSVTKNGSVLKKVRSIVSNQVNRESRAFSYLMLLRELSFSLTATRNNHEKCLHAK